MRETKLKIYQLTFLVSFFQKKFVSTCSLKRIILLLLTSCGFLKHVKIKAGLNERVSVKIDGYSIFNSKINYLTCNFFEKLYAYNLDKKVISIITKREGQLHILHTVQSWISHKFHQSISAFWTWKLKRWWFFEKTHKKYTVIQHILVSNNVQTKYVLHYNKPLLNFKIFREIFYCQKMSHESAK